MTSLHDHTPGGNLVFPSELSGTTFRLVEETLYSAEEAAEEPSVDGEPQYGNWLLVHVAEDSSESFMTAPGELVQELQRLEAEPGEVFTVTRCQKSGSNQSDPYEVNMEEASDEDQERL